MTKPRRRWRRWLFGTLAVLLLIVLVGAAWVADALIRPHRLESLINRALRGATGGLYYVELEGIHWGLGAASVELTGVGIRLDPEVFVARARAGTLPDLLFALQAERIDLLGVDLWGVLQGRGFRALALEMDRPTLRVGLGNWLARRSGGPPGPSSAVEADVPPAAARADQAPDGASSRGAASLPRLGIGRIALNDAVLENYAIPDDPSALNSREDLQMVEKLEDVDFVISGLEIDPTAPPDPDRFLFSDDISIDIGRYGYEWPDGIHSESHGPVHLSTSEGVIAVQNFALTHKDRRQIPADENGMLPPTYALAMDELRLEGIQFSRMLAEKRFEISAFTMRGVRGASYTDEEAEVAPSPRPDVQAAQVAAPVTLERPGSLIARVFGALPPLEVDMLSVTDTAFEQVFDRRDGSFLDEPRIRRGIYGVDIEFRGFQSQPGIEFDPQRPFLSDSVSISLERIEATPDRRHRASIDGFRLDSAASGDIHLGGFLLETLEPRARRGNPADAEDALRFSTGALDLRQVDFGMLMDQLQLNVGSIRLGQPTLEVISTRRRAAATAGEGAGVAERPARSTAPARALDGIIRRLPRLSVGRLAIDDAALSSIHDATEEGWLDAPQTQLRLLDVDFLLDDFDSDPERGYDARAPLVGRASNLSVGSAEAVLGGGTSRLQLDGLAFTAADTTLRIGELSYRPIVGADSAERNARLAAGSVINMDNRGLLIEGIDRIALMRDGDVRATRFALQDPTVDLYVQMPATTARGESAAGPETPSADEPASGDPGLVLAVDLIEIGSADYRRLGAMPDHDWSVEATLLDAFRDVDLTVRGLRLNEPGMGKALALDSLTLEAEELRMTPGQGPDRVRLNEVSLDTGTGVLRAGLLRFGPPTREARFAGEASGLDVATGALSMTGLPMLGLLDAFQSGDKDAWMDVAFASAAKIGIDAIAVELADETPIDVRRLELDVAGSVDIYDVGIDAEADVTVPHLSLRGVGLREMLDTKVIGIAALEVASPRLALPPHSTVEQQPAREAQPAPANRPVGAQPGKPLRDTIERAVAGLPQMRIERLAVTDLQATGLRPDGELAARLDSTNIEISGLDLTDAGRARRDRMLFAEDVYVRSPGYSWTAGNGNDMGIGPIELSTARGSLDLGSFRMVPAATEPEYLARTDVAEGDRVEFRVGSIGLAGIDWNALMDEGALHVRSGHLRDFTVRVLADKKKPKRPPSGKPPGMPHTIFRDLAFPIAVERLELSGGFVRYAERHAEGIEPGYIEFTDLHGDLVNLSNEPARMTLQTPAVLTVRGKIYGEADLQLTWNLPLLEKGPTMSYSGRIGPFPPSLLETILTPLEGVAFPKGQFQAIWFDIVDDTTHATGTFHAEFKGLKVRLQDRNTGKRSFKQRLITFIANIILPNDNIDKPGKPGRVGEIDWLIPPDAPLFKILWVGIREGLIKLLL